MDFYKYLEESPDKETLAKRIAVLRTLKTEYSNNLKKEKEELCKLNTAYIRQYNLYVYKQKKFIYKNPRSAISVLINEELLELLEPVSKEKRFKIYKKINEQDSSNDQVQSQLIIENRLKPFLEQTETTSINILKRGKGEDVKEEFYKLYNDILITGNIAERYIQLHQLKSNLTACLKDYNNSLIPDKEYINCYKYITIFNRTADKYIYTEDNISSYRKAISTIIDYIDAYKIQRSDGLKLKLINSNRLSLIKEKGLYDDLLTHQSSKIVTTTPYTINN